MKKNHIVFYLLIAASTVFSQSKKEWFPDELNIQPFTANHLEPKAGFGYLIGERNIELDIGTSSDFYHYVIDNKTFSFGGDLFTFTKLRGESDFHFPVEAIDYLFGVNAGYKIVNDKNEWGARFRLSHISAHFVDGQYDYANNMWRNGKTPWVYSREFMELFPYYKINTFRMYAGLTYIFHVKPDFIGKGIYQLGFDYFLPELFDVSTSPFVAYDFKLQKIGEYSGSNILSVGFKFGKYDKKGFSILYSYYSGKSIHGEYFDLNEHYSTIGFNLDL